MSKLLDKNMRDFVADYKLGFVATVDHRGFPHVTPKGTFVVIDSGTLAFGDIRSPNTIKNIKTTPQVSINFINPIARRGLLVEGTATVLEQSDAQYAKLSVLFSSFGELAEGIQRIVLVKISYTRNIDSPIYDIGYDESETKREWLAYFQNLSL